jgi:serine/threonine protein kinase
MPLLGGETLSDRLEREGALPPAEVCRIGQEAALGLAALHAKALVHRDIKPSNLWLEAGSGRVKVLDLGLAQDPLATAERSGMAGTPQYMSPEQARGEELDFRTDLFSLGTVLYECATGRRAFTGHTLDEVLRAVREVPPKSAQTLNPGVPHEVALLLARLLAKDPAQRPASAREVAAAFGGLAGSLRQGQNRQFPVPARLIAPIVVAAAVAIAAIGYIAWRTTGSPAALPPASGKAPIGACCAAGVRPGSNPRRRASANQIAECESLCRSR